MPARLPLLLDMSRFFPQTGLSARGFVVTMRSGRFGDYRLPTIDYQPLGVGGGRSILPPTRFGRFVMALVLLLPAIA